jgi:hypothetical protein
LVIATMSASPAAADEFVKGLIGGMIGAAIVNQGNNNNNNGSSRSRTTSKSTASSGVSSETRSKNKGIQEALNYFGFNVGVPDGALGRKSRAAISQLQACLGRPISGELDSFEDQFLSNSYFKAQASAAEALRIVASKPNGYCGLLQQYLQELIAPAQPVVVQQPAPPPPSPTPTPIVSNVAQSTTIVSNQVTNNSTTVIVIDQDIQAKYDLLLNQLKLLEQIQKHISAKVKDEPSGKKLAVIGSRLDELRALIQSIEAEAEGKYGTPIRPTNANLGVTAAKASEVFPRVPYYIPGTEETGELWIKPYVTNDGRLMYDFNLVAAFSDFEKIKDTIEVTPENIRSVSAALVKVTQWSDQAVEKGIRRTYEKSALCFPTLMCGNTEEGNNSAEVFFVIYEDGSTAARLQENKGKFRSAYNFSIESGLLLSAYMDYMAEFGEKEFEANTMTETDLDAIFQD